MEEQLEKLIQMFINKAPELWAIAEKQVYILTTINIILTVIFLAISVVGVVFACKVDKYETELKINGYCVGIMFGIASIGIGLITVPYIFNPEYYILKTLLKLLP